MALRANSSSLFLVYWSSPLSRGIHLSSGLESTFTARCIWNTLWIQKHLLFHVLIKLLQLLSNIDWDLLLYEQQ